jgi:UDP-N-acetylmuramyl pentapeptide phosphotransferase/UDP-N-acetylglucosamine-1-phosphate transferase
LSFCLAFLCSVILTAVVRRWATASALAHGRNDRYHRTIIPMGGGIAITATIVLFLLAGIARSISERRRRSAIRSRFTPMASSTDRADRRRHRILSLFFMGLG